jgi:hypothetical protein
VKKAYYLLFYKLSRFWKTVSEDSWSDWKAGLIIQTLQYIILFIVIGQIEFVTSCNLYPNVYPILWALPLSILLVILNYYLLSNSVRNAYEDEFRRYSNKKNTVINFIVFFFFIGIILLLILTLYQYSKVN